MKYYKLIKDSEHYPSYESNKIYPESFSSKNNLCDVGIHYRSNLNNGSWIEVPAGEYFAQKGIMPEYFAIKRVEDNPLWQKYIDWLNTTYEKELEGCNDYYYGYDGISRSKETTCYRYIMLFENNPVELTLEQWDEIINKTMEEEFELPEKWCVRTDKQEVVDYCNVHGLYPPYKIVEDGTTYAHFPGWNDCTTCNGIKSGYTEITYSQFVKHILNKEVMEENKEIIGWKLKEDFNQYEKAAVDICKAQGSTKINDFKDDDGYAFAKNSNAYDWLRKAGVLEFWFEPVYEEKTLKFGGYDVTFEKVTSGVRISCNGETGIFSQIQAIYNYFKPNSINFKFGSQEVRKVIYDKKEWNIAPDDDEPTSIKIGCTTGTWSEFVAIYEKAKSML